MSHSIIPAKDDRTYFEVLLAAAFASSTARVVASIKGIDLHSVALAEHNARRATQLLGYRCKRLGRDARNSPLYAGIDFKPEYDWCYEKNRKITPDVLTPKLIHDHLLLGNAIVWGDWRISILGHAEHDDLFGRRSKKFSVFVDHKDGRSHRLQNQDRPATRARQAYHLVMGERYSWDDGLPEEKESEPSHYLALT